ncbi:synaptonemal complex protein ZEP1-like isoform X2 [Phragmites australis]|uniref:synaptonemal complex protein ZEP1-like isoform X2 n=1 Tax=Phragmites australis TaxID=29695 RepID=UPI002D786CAA|nr:synaptonemal complex protein ZEP1-like isoform X2 [Phragmites australis]XP_062233963.1 synaptonemal complex protein ZEP1-like isoform X2 [Phragmites australis]
MQKLSGLRGLVGFRSLVGSTSTAVKATNPRPSSDAGGITYGSLANLLNTEEKLVKEQASVKTDLEMAHTKLRRATEHINLLEGLQQAVNESAKLKQTEDSKLLQGLDSKISTKTLCDQLTETLQQLASQTEQAEEDKKFFEEILGKNSTALDEFNCLLHDLSTKLECAEQMIISGKQEKEEMDRSYKERPCANDTTIKEKETK